MNTMPPDRLIDLFLDASHRDVEPRQGQIGHAQMQLKSVDEASRQIHFLCSTGQVDRYGEVVDPDALKAAIPGFMLNPVFVAGHQYSAPGGEPTVIGHWNKLWVSGDGLEGIAQFDDEDPLSLRYWNLYRKGHMRAVSIGFVSKGWEMRELKQTDGQVRRVRVFTEVDLLEISAVTIPANPAALMRAASFSPGNAHGKASEHDAIHEAVKRALNDLLTAGTDVSFTRSLALEIVDVMRSCQGLGGDEYFDDFPNDESEPDSSAASQGNEDETLKAILREALPHRMA